MHLKFHNRRFVRMDVGRPESDGARRKLIFNQSNSFSCPILKIAMAFALAVSLTRAIVPDRRPPQRIALVESQLFSSQGHWQFRQYCGSDPGMLVKLWAWMAGEPRRIYLVAVTTNWSKNSSVISDLPARKTREVCNGQSVTVIRNITVSTNCITLSTNWDTTTEEPRESKTHSEVDSGLLSTFLPIIARQ